MAVTAKLQITKPNSENDASKVVTYNEGFNDLDAAVAGIVNVTVAGADLTLTRAQAVNRILKFVGTLSANITVYLPVVANLALSPPTTTVGSVGQFTVWNATAGAFTLTIKTSAVGSAGVAITQTKKVICFHDGTDVYKATTEV